MKKFLPILLALAASLWDRPTLANTYNVTGFTDGSGTISGGPSTFNATTLRAAIVAADAAGGTHTINLPPGTYNLTLGEIQLGNVAENLTINGQGTPANTVVHMTTTAPDRIFLINPPGTVPNVVTVIQNVTLSGGRLTSDSFGGGAILAGGPANSLTIGNCVFDSNEVPNGNGTGGALNFSGGGALTINNSTFVNNTNRDSSNTGGGAVFLFLQNFVNLAGSLNISGCTFSNNSAAAAAATTGGGGAIGIQTQGKQSGQSFAATISGNTFVNNHATAGYGGAVFVENAFAVGNTVQAHFNRFHGNTAAAGGAGLAYINTQGSVDATDNWWGCNANPASGAGCDTAGTFHTGSPGTLAVNPWIVLKTTASPGVINVGQPTTLTASFLQNSSAGALTAGQIGVLIGLPVTWPPGQAVGGSLSSPQLAIQADGTATATLTGGACGAGSAEAEVDGIPNGDATATASVTVLCSDLTVTKANNVANSTSFGNTWTWTVHVANGGAGFATFANGQTILLDNLPNANVSYGSPSIANASGLTGTVTPSISANDLTCTASGAVQLNSGGSFDVVFSATATATGTFANPRAGGICMVDPNLNVPESNEGNNTAANSVLVNQAATTTAVGSSVNPSGFGQSVTFTATVSAVAPGAGTPTGTAQFVIDGSPAATQPLVTGAASFTISTLSVGNHSVTAVYSGDADFTTSASAPPLSQTVNATPTAGPDTLGTTQNTAVNAPVAKLLANDTSPVNGPLSITGVTSPSAQGGTVSLNSGFVVYTPAPSFIGTDTFHYTLSDTHATAQGTVTVTVSPDGQTLNTLSITGTLPNVALTFAGIPGQSYVVQWATSPTGPWTDFADGTIVAGATGLIHYTDSTQPPPPSRFFRTRAGSLP